MIILSWLAQARNLSHRRSPRSESDTKSRSKDSTIPENLRPALLDDGSHPYYPGTPWNELELASTIDEGCKPRNAILPSISNRRHRGVFKRRHRRKSESEVRYELPPYFGSLQPTGMRHAFEI